MKYTNNEIYFDLTEELDAVIDVNGKVLTAEAFGYINVDCRLSGMPEIVMCFLNAHIIDDVSLHPCVRLRRWEQDRVLSFVPPDSDFRLLSYRSTGNVGIPVHVRHAVHITGVNAGRLDISISTGRISSPKAELTEIEIQVINLPRFVSNFVADTSQGKAMFDIQKKVLTWEVGRIDTKKLPTMKGKVSCGCLVKFHVKMRYLLTLKMYAACRFHLTPAEAVSTAMMVILQSIMAYRQCQPPMEFQRQNQKVLHFGVKIFIL